MERWFDWQDRFHFRVSLPQLAKCDTPSMCGHLDDTLELGASGVLSAFFTNDKGGPRSSFCFWLSSAVANAAKTRREERIAIRKQSYFLTIFNPDGRVSSAKQKKPGKAANWHAFPGRFHSRLVVKLERHLNLPRIEGSIASGPNLTKVRTGVVARA